MRTHHRDGLLAGAALVAVVATALATHGSAPFVRPLAAVAGVGGTLAIEGAFLRYPDRLLAVWERPGVGLAGVGVVGGSALAAVFLAPWLLGAVGWGLLTYLALLSCVLAGLGNPLAALVPPVRRG